MKEKRLFSLSIALTALAVVGGGLWIFFSYHRVRALDREYETTVAELKEKQSQVAELQTRKTQLENDVKAQNEFLRKQLPSPDPVSRPEDPGHGSKALIKDEEAMKQLLGSHPFSLQWIGFWEYFGQANVTENEGVLNINGRQDSRTDDDYITIDGVITEVDTRVFIFKGIIVTRISYINDGKPCKREGIMTFAITGNRKYWRLQDMLNPCTKVETDYVDIFRQ